MNVSLKADWENFVNAKVQSGEYETASEVIRDGLRLLKYEDDKRKALLQALRGEIHEGVEQLRRGDGHPASEVFDELLADL